MKAIQIKSELKSSFLKACGRAGLEATQLKKINKPGWLFFRVSKPNISQDDIFKLGVYFSHHTFSK